jgi:hypothetical protein
MGALDIVAASTLRADALIHRSGRRLRVDEKSLRHSPELPELASRQPTAPSAILFATETEALRNREVSPEISPPWKVPAVSIALFQAVES